MTPFEKRALRHEIGFGLLQLNNLYNLKKEQGCSDDQAAEILALSMILLMGTGIEVAEA